MPVGYKALSTVPPVVLVIIGTLSIQFGGALAFTIFDDVGPAGTALLRLSLSAVLLLAVARPSLRGRSASDWRLVVIFGLTLGVMNLCFYEAVARLPLGVAVTIEFLGPITLAGALSRKPVQWLWVITAALGVVMLAAPWTASNTLDRVGVALLCSAIPYTTEAEALRRMPARVFSVLMSIEPAVAALAGLLVLGQQLPLRDLAAIGLVIVASVGVMRGADFAPPAEAAIEA